MKHFIALALAQAQDIRRSLTQLKTLYQQTVTIRANAEARAKFVSHVLPCSA